MSDKNQSKKESNIIKARKVREILNHFEGLHVTEAIEILSHALGCICSVNLMSENGGVEEMRERRDHFIIQIILDTNDYFNFVEKIEKMSPHEREENRVETLKKFRDLKGEH